MSLWEFLKVVCLGIVEGITEWLPISSTGHLILFDELLRLDVSDEFWNMFLVVIQLGAILAVVYLYFDKLNIFSARKSFSEKRAALSLWGKVIVACLPAAVLGLLFDDWMDEHLRGSAIVAWALIVYGVLFIVLEQRNAGRSFRIDSLDGISYPTALGIGCFQVLSLVPGTSRSGSTILGAMLLGVNRRDSAEFSFFLAIPVMFGASFLKLVKFGLAFTYQEALILLTGMLVSFVVSVLAIKFLMAYIKGHDFQAFGWYRIVLGIVVLAAGAMGIIGA
ncbi:MAG: undecaprenyl-diphosphate phosphatase [Firmicutes bacterium]|nr:undecaprenyl-diphosphate phosphatase [Bacillota bacterium]